MNDPSPEPGTKYKFENPGTPYDPWASPPVPDFPPPGPQHGVPFPKPAEPPPPVLSQGVPPLPPPAGPKGKSKKEKTASHPPLPPTVPSAPKTAAARAAMPYRPVLRPTTALLTVFDDGSEHGEQIRLRDGVFVIGRVEGNLLLPHDTLVSGRHLEIVRQPDGRRWVVNDLASKHGLFVRMRNSALKDETEFLVGGGRYKFNHVPWIPAAPDAIPDLLPKEPPAAPRTTPPALTDASLDIITGLTHGYPEAPADPAPPVLVELVGSSIGNRVLLTLPEYWIGSDPACAIPRPDDPFCEPRHARIFRKDDGWFVEHPKTSNGLWCRRPRLEVDSHAQFQIGEQRFKLEILGASPPPAS